MRASEPVILSEAKDLLCFWHRKQVLRACGAPWEDSGQSGTRPVRTPSETASVRERTPSFSSTAARWYLTVCVVLRKSAAISLLLKPRATSRNTSSSRAVSAAPACATAPAHHSVGEIEVHAQLHYDFESSRSKSGAGTASARWSGGGVRGNPLFLVFPHESEQACHPERRRREGPAVRYREQKQVLRYAQDDMPGALV